MVTFYIDANRTQGQLDRFDDDIDDNIVVVVDDDDDDDDDNDDDYDNYNDNDDNCDDNNNNDDQDHNNGKFLRQHLYPIYHYKHTDLLHLNCWVFLACSF